MARRDNRIAIDEGPDFTDLFRSTDAGGTDGIGLRSVLISCAADSANPIEYRIESPADPEDEVGYLAPGEVVRLSPPGAPIQHITARGVGGAATGGVEDLLGS